MFLNFLTSSNTDVISDSSVTEAVSEMASENTASGGLNIDLGRFIEMLPYLAIGMISIFIVIGIIILATSLLNKIFSKKKKKDE